MAAQKSTQLGTGSSASADASASAGAGASARGAAAEVRNAAGTGTSVKKGLDTKARTAVSADTAAGAGAGTDTRTKASACASAATGVGAAASADKAADPRTDVGGRGRAKARTATSASTGTPLAPGRRLELRICHLYPRTLNLYGDRGNVLCLAQRLRWRGIGVSVTQVDIGDVANLMDFDLIFIGGGQDFDQTMLLDDLVKGRAGAIKQAVENDRTFLAVCGGYQLLGTSYQTITGERFGFAGALDIHTIASSKRMIGNCIFKTEAAEGDDTLVGFENHSGRTYLGEGVKPLGHVLTGFGNNGEDGTEGAHHRNVFGTYAHGPLLPKNPRFADHLLRVALQRRYPDIELVALNDRLEDSAHDAMIARITTLLRSRHRR